MPDEGIGLVHAFFSHSSPLHPESGNVEKDGEAEQSEICHLFTDLFIILVIREIESLNLMRVEGTEDADGDGDHDHHQEAEKRTATT